MLTKAPPIAEARAPTSILVKLAERNGSMILHYVHESQHQYLVKVSEVTYSYRIDPQQVTSEVSVPEG